MRKVIGPDFLWDRKVGNPIVRCELRRGDSWWVGVDDVCPILARTILRAVLMLKS